MERNFTGKTIDDAIKAASEELGLAREDFSVDVIENPKSGFLVLGAKPAVIKVTYKNEVNAVEFVEEFLDGLMEKMGIMEYELKVTEPEEKEYKSRDKRFRTRKPDKEAQRSYRCGSVHDRSCHEQTYRGVLQDFR